MPRSEPRKLIEPGTLAPGFRLPRLDGSEITLQQIIVTGPALLAFFKISCPVCQLAFPFLNRIHSGTIPVYGISQNDAASTREFASRFGNALPILLDSQGAGFPVSNAYGISSVPTMFLIEMDGAVSRVLEGWRKQEIADLGIAAGVNPFRPGENVPEWKAG